ncbi:MAG: PEP-CTERM sorting domain-containing protein [Caldimonas sp.]
MTQRISEGIMNGVAAPVPEPETVLLMATGLLVLAARRRCLQRR